MKKTILGLFLFALLATCLFANAANAPATNVVNNTALAANPQPEVEAPAVVLNVNTAPNGTQAAGAVDPLAVEATADIGFTMVTNKAAASKK